MITLKEAYVLLTKVYATLLSDAVNEIKLDNRHIEDCDFEYSRNINPEYDLFHENKKEQIKKENKQNNLILKNHPTKNNFEK